MVKQKEINPLPTAEVIEGILLMDLVLKKKTFSIEAPKISNEMYMEIVKEEVMK